MAETACARSTALTPHFRGRLPGPSPAELALTPGPSSAKWERAAAGGARAPLPLSVGEARGEGSSRLAPRWARARNVLAARLDNVGDVIMCGPALRAIRESLPGARLTLWASPGGAAAAALLPYVDDVLATKVIWQDLGGMPLDAGRERSLVEELRGRGFDAALIFTSFAQSPYPPAYACYLAEIPLRAGQSKEFGGGLLTTWVRPLPDETHQVDRNLHLLEELGFAVRDRALFVAVPPEARESAATLARHGLGPIHHLPSPPTGRGRTHPPGDAATAKASGYAVLHPAASCPARTYPWQRFVAIGRELARRLGLRIVLTGTARERELIDGIAAEIGPAAVPIAGETTLPELAAVVDGAALIVANNTSLMHVADALRTPSVILFAGTELESQWRPRSTRARLLRRDTWCSPCYQLVCPTRQECLDVPPAEVVEAAMEVLDEA